VPTLFGSSPGGQPAVLGLRGESLYVAMDILGATVMPHNLYLHSALVQSRNIEATPAGRKDACRMNLVDSAVALNAAMFVNLAILVLAAATFHRHGFTDVGSLKEAHRLLSPLLGTRLAPTLFAVALLCAGQDSTVTGTLAGQIVMEGFLRVRVRPWLRRLVSRGLAIIPAAAVILWQGERGVDNLLVYLVLAPLLARGWPRLVPASPGPALAAAGSRGARGAGLAALAEPRRWSSGSYRRIAIAVELADTDDTVLQFLRHAQLTPEVELVFVHVAESAASRWLGEQSLDSESREDLQALESLAREFGLRGIRTGSRPGHGEPAPEIARIVGQERADLLVTGSHGHKGLSDAVFGATVSSVRHLVACPILTVPARGRG
jgi:nucleotide-binding universal stress UspA family protein